MRLKQILCERLKKKRKDKNGTGRICLHLYTPLFFFFEVIIIVFHIQLLTGVIDTIFANQFSVVLINTSNKWDRQGEFLSELVNFFCLVPDEQPGVIRSDRKSVV